MPLSVALDREWACDAHLAAYAAPSLERRLRGAALLPEHLVELGGVVSMHVLIFDIDGPGHRADESWWSEQSILVRRVREEHYGVLAWRTRGGYRLLGRLASPVELRAPDDARTWKALYLAWVVHLERTFGIVADRACSDWQRLYRLPHATRTPGGQPERLDVVGDPRAVGVWGDVLSQADIAAGAAAAGPARAPWRPRGGGGGSVPGTGTGVSVLSRLFALRGWLCRDEQGGRGGQVVLCPWRDRHGTDTDGTDSTVIFAPEGGELGQFRCLHNGCRDRRAGDVLELFDQDEINRANGRPTRAERAAARRAAEPPWPGDEYAPGGAR